MKIRNLKILKDPILRVCMLVTGASIVILGLIFAISYRNACDHVLDGSIRLARLNVEKAEPL